ncbi:hypothetical protein RSAG8_02690, partial [Rhizoctonia solani AG-8 WAC10335]
MKSPLALLLLLGSRVYAQDSTKRHKGESCDPTRNRLSAETRKFSSDCDAMTFCSAEGVCQPKGCRRDEFPFGYDPDVTLPPMCPREQFCPDEEDMCLPVMSPGSACQLNRDDQCQPPSDRPELEDGYLSNRQARLSGFNYGIYRGLSVMIGVSITLFMSHKRSRAKKLNEIRAYFREQTSYRNSIISMHTTAKSRLSTHSASSYRDSFSHFGRATRESYEDDEDGDRRGLLARRPEDEHPEHQEDSDGEGAGYVHNLHGGDNFAPIRQPPGMNSVGGWSPSEWGVARRW